MMPEYFKILSEAKQVMNTLIMDGKFEAAGLLGVIYQTPIRMADACRLKKSDIINRELHIKSGRQGIPYLNMDGSNYRISRQLEHLLFSLNPKSDILFPRNVQFYRKQIYEVGKFKPHELRHTYLVFEQQRKYPYNPNRMLEILTKVTLK